MPPNLIYTQNQLNKIMRYIFLILIFNFSISNINAQIDRSIGNSQYRTDKQNKKVDVVENSVQLLKEKLKLDGLQEAIIRNLIKENQTKTKEIIENSKLSDIEKKDLLVEIGEKLNSEIKKVLSKEQYALYEKLINKKKN
jgi:hypothetical protein